MIAFLLSLFLQSGADTSGLMARGVSHELAEHRAKEISGVHYALSLDLTRLDTVRGTARLVFTLRGTNDVIVDFRGPTLSAVAVNGQAVARPDWNGAHLHIAKALVRS